MKKILSILGAVGLTATSSSLIISCSWNTPPIDAVGVSQIFKIVQGDVHQTWDGNNIPVLKGEFSKLPTEKVEAIKEETDETKIAEAIRNITDPLNGEISSFVLNKIQSMKNIITDEDQTKKYEDAGFNSDRLSKLSSGYFSVRIGDILVNETWLSSKAISSEQKGYQTVRFRNKDKKIAINSENRPVGSAFDIENGDISIALTMNLTAFLNSETGKFEGNINKIRYLISINPDESKFSKAKDIAFYIDVNY